MGQSTINGGFDGTINDLGFAEECVVFSQWEIHDLGKLLISYRGILFGWRVLEQIQIFTFKNFLVLPSLALVSQWLTGSWIYERGSGYLWYPQ